MSFMFRGIGSLAAIAVAGPLMAASPLVSPHELNALMAEGKAIVLDVRGPAAGYDAKTYEAGHIPGAISAPLGNEPWRATVDNVPIQMAPVAVLEPHLQKLGIDAGSHVVVVWQGKAKNLGDFANATRVYWTLKAAGLKNVSILNGGVEAWTKAGYGLVGAPSEAARPGTVKVKLDNSIIADLPQVMAAYEAKSKVLLDARPWAQYSGAEKSGVTKAAGTIPGALNATAVNFMDGNLVMDRAAIRAKAAQIGLKPSDDIITFCNGGYFCSALWFVMHEVGGFDKMKVYDGSMAEWTMDPARPVAPGSWASLNKPLTN
jgi:thiosulfate/3-mercaptopyruvate sulfurtransferase